MRGVTLGGSGRVLISGSCLWADNLEIGVLESCLPFGSADLDFLSLLS